MTPTNPGDGLRIRQGAASATGVFAVATLVAVLIEDARPLAAVVASALFAAGCGAYLLGYAQVVRRSRTEQIEIGAFVFLSGSAPPSVRRLLLGCTAGQTVIAVAGAALRPFTLLAFGILAPMFGLGVQALWAARYGTFPARAIGGSASGGSARPKDRAQTNDDDQPEQSGLP